MSQLAVSELQQITKEVRRVEQAANKLLERMLEALPDSYDKSPTSTTYILLQAVAKGLVGQEGEFNQ
ncbi:hypothetical protein [Alicyclobacillus suci]|uniref:hypothetical protein n=1 Tax=Alicyclobacillus suci TaxID=2816080 RepID=UPI001A8C97D8|nr:hypothetical protein [Alicyclobacillus suci]